MMVFLSVLYICHYIKKWLSAFYIGQECQDFRMREKTGNYMFSYPCTSVS